MIQKDKAKIIAIILCLLGGGVLIFLSINTIKSDMAFMSNAEKTWATVESVWQHTDNDGDVEYTVDVEYVVGGKVYEGTYKTSLYVSYKSEVIIYYDRYNPSVMRTFGNRFNGFYMLGAGVTFAIAGAFIMFKGGKCTATSNRKYY